jgi:hypothetical protein
MTTKEANKAPPNCLRQPKTIHPGPAATKDSHQITRLLEALHAILGLYSNAAVAWVFAVFADLVINKPLKLSPPIVEFKRAHLYDFNPVGFVSMLISAFVSILAFGGLFGDYAQAYSWLFAMLLSLILSPLIAIITFTLINLLI